MRTTAFLLALAAAATGGAARASDPATNVAHRSVGEAVSVEGSDDCVEHAALGADVVHWLGRDTVDARVSVHVRVGPPGIASAGFTVLRVGAPATEKQLDFVQASCADRRTALALAVALSIDAAVLDAIEEALAAAPPPPPRRHFALSAVGEGLYTSGVVLDPAAAGYGGLEVGFLGGGEKAGSEKAGADARIEGWLVRIGALGTAGSSAPLGPGRVTAALVAARLDGCLARDAGRHSVQACAGVAVGRVSAQGEAFDHPEATNLGWAAVAGRLAVQAPLSRLVALRLVLDGVAPFVRPRFAVGSPAGATIDARSLPPAGLGVGAGLVLRLR